MKTIGSAILIRRGNRNTTLNFTPKQVELLKFLRDYLAGVGEFNPHKGIFLLGRNGTGKTLIIMSFIDLIRRLTFPNRLVKHYHAKEILSLLEKKKELKSYFNSARSFYIEDIGKEEESVNIYGTIVKPFPDFIDSIYGISTGWHFLCSNYKIDEPRQDLGEKPYPGGKLFQMYGKTITGRITEMFNLYVLRGEDMRK
jgi:DNA replication protein DnaC